MYLDDDTYWKPLFSLLKDNSIHMSIIREIVKTIGYDVEEFKKHVFKTTKPKKYEFSEDYFIEILQEILNWEKWAYRFYENMLKFAEEIEEYLSDEQAERIRKNLNILANWEKKHIELVKSLIK
jgi:rubrerythrin